MQEEKKTSPLRLERLELFGFKSFPEKTVFAFEPGITAIVGPNGCGKTNVVDSIRWVLGEQSAYSMRGSRMEEVIFGGTEKMKPLGMSEVSITLRNENGYLPIDYAEVSVTRRLFRSGESEYLINKNPCRLKDVQELFMDTGVGTKAYSFIEQGKVDLILSSRPEERRFLFEEAAGIGKYKSRKREAERKLESTEQNLIRLNDIIAEVQRQINSLKRQVAKAKRYSSLSEKLKEIETLNAVNEYKALRSSLEASLKRFEESSGLVRRLSGEVSEGESRLRELRKALEEKERESALIHEKLGGVNEQAMDLNSRVMLYRERISSLGEKIKSSEKDKETLNLKLGSLQKELEGLDSDILRMRDEILLKEKELKNREERLDEIAGERKDAGKKAELLKGKVVDAASDEAKARSRRADLEAVLRNLEAREKRLKGERAELGSRAAACAESLAAAEQEYGRLREEAGRVNMSLSAAEEKISTLNGRLESLRGELSALRGRLESGSSALALMEEMKMNFEGYGAGVKAVLSEKESLPGMRPLGDMAEVRAEFRPAIESALRETVQYIAAGSFPEALKALTFLKENKAGRAGFLLIDEARKKPKGQEPPDEILNEPGIMGKASEIVKFKEGFEFLGEFLLSGTVVAENAECAARVLKKLPAGCRVVTLEGDLYDPSGFVTGGSPFSSGSGLVGREKAISELKDSLSRMKDGLSAIERRERESAEVLRESLRERDAISENFREISGNLLRSEGDCQRFKSEAQKIREDLSVVEGEIASAESEKAFAAEEVLAASKELEDSLARKNDLDYRLSSLQGSLENAAGEREKLLSEITELRVETARLKEKEESSRSHFMLKQQSLAECEDDISRRRKDVEESSRLIAEHSSAVEGFEDGLGKLAEEKKLHAGAAEASGMECRELSREIGALEEELSLARESLNKKQDDMHRTEMGGSELKMRIKALQDKMYSRHRVDIESASAENAGEGIDIESLNDEAARIQAKLDAMGPVNLIAIEEHKELEERLEFLSSQSDDLASAKETLQKAISRINQTARSMFLDSFKLINASFGEIFTMLFNGGRAELILVDEKNVLESGIEIIARPPGKKLQSISLLSGGEKAMTAIALLFAILKNKPSPFCVLDEIDAALDDANIGRFVDMVRGFSEETQFLIVTHNKSTISAASMIYGITMEEEGVSKPISIRFSEKGGSEYEIENFAGGEPSRAV